MMSTCVCGGGGGGRGAGHVQVCPGIRRWGEDINKTLSRGAFICCPRVRLCNYCHL